jgi:hypothetical protein
MFSSNVKFLMKGFNLGSGRDGSCGMILTRKRHVNEGNKLINEYSTLKLSK